jgi:hypothetical protein
MADWNYGNAHLRHDMQGEIHLPNGSTVEVCDWTVRMPDFMKRADVLFVDPPWNAGNVRSFYTKADLPSEAFDFADFLGKLWGRIDEIAPLTLFLEMGKENLHRCVAEAEKRWKHVTFYNSTYYHKRENKTYMIHATDDFRTRRHKELEDMDEEDIIAWVCRNARYAVIGDLCMGRGLVGRHAYAAGRPFVGTELNRKRLAVLVEHIAEAEAKGRKAAA